MKRFFQILMVMLVALMLPVVAFCQDGVSVSDLVFNPSEYFTSLSALVAGVLAVTEVAKRFLGTFGNWTKYLSWIVAFALSFAGWFLKLGIFVGIEWYWVLAYGLGAGLVANSVFDLSIVKGLLSIFKTSK